jgi:hypothetical protein
MGILLGKRFYLISFPEVPIYKVDCALLDANAIGAIYDWATNPKKIDSTQILPVLELIRKVKAVESIFGSIENAWRFPDDNKVDSTNFNDIRFQDVINKLIAIDSIIEATPKQFKQWSALDRTGSIDFLDKKSTRAASLNVGDVELKELSSLVAPEWLSFLLLILSIEKIEDSASYEDRKEAYFAWLKQVYEVCPLRAFVNCVALIAFFGGTLRHQYFDSETKQVINAREVGHKEVLKMQEWSILGKARIARNLAFDSLYFYERSKIESGIIQLPDKKVFVKGKGMTAGIISGDKVMNALNTRIEKRIQVRTSILPAYVWKPPADSLIYQYGEVADLLDISSLYARNPEELPDHSEIESRLKLLLDSLVGI